MGTDILFSTEEYIFSYRVAGILVQDEKVLLQCPEGDTAHAFPGGHIKLGETNEEALVREFQEETGFAIAVGKLDWVVEMLFPWGDKNFHQICLYYRVTLKDSVTVPHTQSFLSSEADSGIHFYWVPIEKTSELELYPVEAKELLQRLSDDRTDHFVSRQS